MKNIFFLPHWYLENKREKRKRMLKFFISVIVVTDLILLGLLIFRLNKVKVLESDIKQKTASQKNEYLKKNKKQINNDKTLEGFSTIIKSIADNVNFQSIYIKDKNVDIQINSKAFDYTEFIKEIEKENKFSIKGLDIPEQEENGKFQINIELK